MPGPDSGHHDGQKNPEHEGASLRQKAKGREKEDTSKVSDFSKMERKGNMNKSARRDVKSARGKRPMAVKADEEKSKISVREAPKQFSVQLPKDETDLTCLQLEGELAHNAKAMEEYRVALQQIYQILTMMIRRGNGTTDNDNFKTEKGQAAAERLNREVVQTENFWKSDTSLQPAMNQAIAKNSAILAAAERNLQEQGPNHMLKLKKFLHTYYPRYIEMKKELAKVVKQQKPDYQTVRAEHVKTISDFVKAKYLDAKLDHLGEIQSVFVELSFFHHASASAWNRIAERKLPPKPFQPETFDFKQFSHPPPKG